MAMLANDARILFTGIYDIGIASLESLASRSFNLIGVVTKPESEGGMQPVAAWAKQHELPLLSPVSPRSDEFIRQVQSLMPDLTVVAGYHKIIPKPVLDIPHLGTINLHVGLLPAYRGPCAWKWAIINGDTHTGLTVHMMSPKLDCGDILTQREFLIDDDDTGGTLFGKLSKHGAELLVESLERMQHESLEPRPQDETRSTYFSYPTDQDARISWRDDAIKIRNLVRGLNPSPGAWTCHRGRRMIIDTVDVYPTRSTAPGKICERTEQGIIVGTSTNDVLIRRLHLDVGPAPTTGNAAQHLGIYPGDCFE